MSIYVCVCIYIVILCKRFKCMYAHMPRKCLEGCSANCYWLYLKYGILGGLKNDWTYRLFELFFSMYISWQKKKGVFLVMYKFYSKMFLSFTYLISIIIIKCLEFKYSYCELPPVRNCQSREWMCLLRRTSGG